MTLPTGWANVALGEICELLNGRAYKQTELLAAGKWPVLRVGNFFSNRGWYYSDLELEDDKYCDNGDLLYAWSASFGPRIWKGGKVIFHYHIWKTQPDPNALDKGYLYRWFDWDTNNIKSDHGTGTTMIHVTKGDMEKRSLPLPPLAEQRRIVAKLDTLTARLTRARTELDRVAAMAGDIRKRSVDFAFAKLARCRLGDVAQSIRYGYTDSAKPEGPGSKFLRITDIQNRKVDWSKVPYVDVGPSDLARCALQTGDIVFARSGATVGKSFLIDKPPENAVFASYLIRVRLDADQLLPAAAAYFFQSADYWDQIEAGVTGTGQPNFNGSKLAELSVPFGDVDAQKAAIERIDNAFARADRLEAEAARARALLDRLEAAILARAFRGELVPQDPADEPASALLDRIRSERAAAPAARRGKRAVHVETIAVAAL